MEPTPADAAAALREASTYEESLSIRTSGLTTMMWGLVAAGIFMTYAGVGSFFHRHGTEWAFNVVWIPWVATGILLTRLLWSSHAVTLEHDDHWRKDLLVSLGFVGAFIAVAMILFMFIEGTDAHWATSAIMLATNGFLALGIAVMHRRAWCFRDPSLFVAAFTMIGAGLWMGFAGLGDLAASLLGGVVAGVAWITAGAIAYSRG